LDPREHRRNIMSSPAELRYSKDHEWVRVQGDRAVIGITAHAANELGDVVFVDLPQVGATLKQFTVFGAVESVKAVSDLFSPISGSVLARNEALSTAPESINADPYGSGWLLEIQLGDPSELNQLLDAAGYDQLTA
jgi:glycine cleavage system H protein